MDETMSESTQTIKIQLHALMQLQEVDDKLNQRRAQIKAIDVKIKDEDKTLTHQSFLLDERKQEIETITKDRREAEVTVKQKQEESQKLGGQLFDVKTNEAYSTLQKEISQKKQDAGLLEERIIEMMVAEDEMKLKLKEAEEALKEGEEQVAAKQAEQHKGIKDLESEIESFKTQWESVATKVQPDYLDLYKRLLKNKAGSAMAKIENDICTGCRLAIRPQASIELRKYRSLLFCDNCARILYVD
ncbi:hypothetical protein K8S19_00930 [bacterium]|nr:hypothetical protein [bacterium]